ncbi:MAG: T9SS type A sorting domain-containing protein [Bacteroidetes bacterium]|nr:T9SS type A sorting domain-containing protein [Bacteroidota bacterium]
MKKILLCIFLFCFLNSYAQYTQQWVDRLNGTANSYDIANNMYLDSQGNVYIYSTLSNTGSQTDICAVKYSASGQMLWKFVYNGPSSNLDQFQDVYKDSQNFSYITGYTNDSNIIKHVLLKLNPLGDTVWTRINSISNHENLISRSVCVDNSGNIFVAADARNLTSGMTDFVLMKFNASGNLINQKIYAAPSNCSYNSVKALCDASGNIFAGVNFSQAPNGFDIEVFKFDNNLGEIFLKRINGAGNSDDGIFDMKFSQDNNVVLAGKISSPGSASDMAVIKLNASSGNILWQKSYNGSGSDIDIAYSLAFDNLDNVLVTGYARNSNTIGSEDVVTLKYSSSGELIWSKIFNDSTHGIDQGYSICSDSQNNVYVGAVSDHADGHVGYTTLKYNSDGSLIWKGKYHYFALSEDFIYKIAVNSAQDIFVTGISFSNTTDYDVTTIKYAYQTGIYTSPETVRGFILFPSYPSPFNPSAVIRFYNPQKEFTIIKIFDINGREVTELVNTELNSGEHKFIFDASGLPGGVYFYKILHGSFLEAGKMIYTK